VTRPRRPDSPTDQRFGRRGLLRAGVTLTMVAPVLAACTSTPPPAAPDALLPVLAAAREDARTATGAAAAFPNDAATWRVIAAMRQQHADALAKEITRAGTTPTTTAPPATTAPAVATSEPDAFARIRTALRAAQAQAAALVPTTPRYRAGLLGSVSAGCASMLAALG